MDENEVQTTETNYIEVIKNLKDTTVSKAEYERVLAENKTLANAFATSTPASTETVEAPTHTQEEIDALTTRLTSKHLTNLDYIKTSLDLRDAVMAVHGVDPFLPTNSDYVPSEADVNKANAIADGLRQMVEYSNGDPQLFNSELKRNCK